MIKGIESIKRICSSLLSGLAGSGKSTAVEKMKKYVLEEYSTSSRE